MAYDGSCTDDINYRISDYELVIPCVRWCDCWKFSQSAMVRVSFLYTHPTVSSQVGQSFCWGGFGLIWPCSNYSAFLVLWLVRFSLVRWFVGLSLALAYGACVVIYIFNLILRIPTLDLLWASFRIHLGKDYGFMILIWLAIAYSGSFEYDS